MAGRGRSPLLAHRGLRLVPDAQHTNSLFPSLLQPPPVEQFFINQEGGVPFYAGSVVAANGALIAELRQFIAGYHVGVVLVDRATPHSGAVAQVLSRALGRPPVVSGGIDAWYDADRTPTPGAAR